MTLENGRSRRNRKAMLTDSVPFVKIAIIFTIESNFGVILDCWLQKHEMIDLNETPLPGR